MSQENVEIARSIYASFDQGDEAAWELLPPDLVVDFTRRLIDPFLGGRDEARALYDRGRHEAFEEGRVGWELKELIDAGDKVLAFIWTSGRGKASSVEVGAHVWNVWTFRDGKPVEWTYFGDDRAAALEAVGLSEQDAHTEFS
jgi:ketosteroid isomerase-like protein